MPIASGEIPCNKEPEELESSGMVGARVAFPMALPVVFELRLAALFHGGLSTSGTSGQSFLTTAMKLANLQHIVCLIGTHPTVNK